MSDEELDFVAKANMALATFAPGGVLLPEQAEQIVEKMIIKSKLLQLCTTKMMDRPQWEQPRMGFDGQVLFPDDEFAITPEAQRASPTTDKRELSVKRLKAVGKISYRTLKSVVGRGNFQPFVIDLLTKAAKRDLERLIINGDTALPATTSINRLLRMMDGLVKKAASYVYDAAGQPVNPTVLDELSILMPDQFSDDEGMAYITSYKAAIRYRQGKAARPTPGGDSQLLKMAIDDHHGSPILGIPLIPSNLGTLSNETIVLKVNPKNILIGFQDDMEIEIERHADAGMVVVVLRYGADVIYEDPDAVTKATGVQALAA
jgi:hypothetical protein